VRRNIRKEREGQRRLENRATRSGQDKILTTKDTKEIHEGHEELFQDRSEPTSSAKKTQIAPTLGNAVQARSQSEFVTFSCDSSGSTYPRQPGYFARTFS
jgi:hypothetical protein